MKVISKGGVEWFLEDEGLISFVEGLSLVETGKRGYFTGQSGGRRVFVKAFNEKGLQGLVRNLVSPRGKREYESAKSLLTFSVPAPVPLGYGVSRMRSYILEEWLEGESLLHTLKTKGCNADLLAALVSLLRTLKAHKVRHNDLHLDNILMVLNRPHLIDLHAMKIKTTFTLEDEVSNLSHALAVLYRYMDEGQKEAFFREYGKPDLRTPVEREVERKAERWFARKKDRALEGTSLLVSKGAYRFLKGMEGKGQGQLQGLVKEDRKTTVERYGDHIRKVYRNRRRLERAWKAHVVLAYMNLYVTPQAYCVKMPSRGSRGYIAMEDLGDRGEELDRHLDRRYDRMALRERRNLCCRLALFFTDLFRDRVVHKDLKGCNIFVMNDGRFVLLDVEDISFSKAGSKDLARMQIQLNNTIPKRISSRDRLRFFLGVTEGMKGERRRLLHDIVKGSRAGEIVYEGTSGLVRDRW
jgi:tRNA A-37 threonylcarbamoyl transferase component Bud32